MIEFGLTLLFLLIIVAAMSVGVLMGRKPMTGSCGGIKALGMGADCAICGGDQNRCENADSATDGRGNQLATDVTANS